MHAHFFAGVVRRKQCVRKAFTKFSSGGFPVALHLRGHLCERGGVFMQKEGVIMALRLIIPDFIPAVDRRAVLERIRADKREALADMAGVRARGCVPIDNIKAVRRRIRSLVDLERAWMSVQMDAAA